jgi:hypothetical protein
MNQLIQVNLTMNPYLFGSLLLLALWWVTFIALRFTGKRDQIPEFWWASFSCALLGITEPLFVPEYWNPPSILKIGRWDVESFVFCFAVGGMAAVLTELPKIKSFLVRLYFGFEQIVRSVLSVFSKFTRGRLHARILDRPSSSRLVPREQTRIENMLLVTFAVGMFGATSHFSLNIIYDVAFVCIATAMMIGWRRPSLRWQILGGGLSFTIIYTVVLVIMDKLYPAFYNHWNLEALSGIFFLDAPIEEYLFSFTFGIFWAPLYEAWKEVREEHRGL